MPLNYKPNSNKLYNLTLYSKFALQLYKLNATSLIRLIGDHGSCGLRLAGSDMRFQRFRISCYIRPPHECSARQAFRITIVFQANGYEVLIRNRALPLMLNTRLQPIRIHDVLCAISQDVSSGAPP